MRRRLLVVVLAIARSRLRAGGCAECDPGIATGNHRPTPAVSLGPVGPPERAEAVPEWRADQVPHTEHWATIVVVLDLADGIDASTARDLRLAVVELMVNATDGTEIGVVRATEDAETLVPPCRWNRSGGRHRTCLVGASPASGTSRPAWNARTPSSSRAVGLDQPRHFAAGRRGGLVGRPDAEQRADPQRPRDRVPVAASGPIHPCDDRGVWKRVVRSRGRRSGPVKSSGRRPAKARADVARRGRQSPCRRERSREARPLRSGRTRSSSGSP